MKHSKMHYGLVAVFCLVCSVLDKSDDEATPKQQTARIAHKQPRPPLAATSAPVTCYQANQVAFNSLNKGAALASVHTAPQCLPITPTLTPQ